MLLILGSPRTFWRRNQCECEFDDAQTVGRVEVVARAVQSLLVAGPQPFEGLSTVTRERDEVLRPSVPINARIVIVR